MTRGGHSRFRNGTPQIALMNFPIDSGRIPDVWFINRVDILCIYFLYFNKNGIHNILLLLKSVHLIISSFHDGGSLNSQFSTCLVSSFFSTKTLQNI